MLRHLYMALGPMSVQKNEQVGRAIAAVLAIVPIGLAGRARGSAGHDPSHRTDDRALRGAACHGCLLIAETSCEARNLHLDRALLVGTMATACAGFFAV